MHTLASVTSILNEVARTLVQAKMPSGIARTIKGVTKEAVCEVVAVLDALPYVEVGRTNAGYLKGLGVHYREKGCCSIVYGRTSEWGYQFYVDGTLTSSVSATDKQRVDKLRDEAAKQAADLNLPLLCNRTLGHITVIAPFVLAALLKKDSENAHTSICN